MGKMCFEGCLLFQGTEGIRVDEECEEGTISQTVYEFHRQCMNFFVRDFVSYFPTLWFVVV